MDSPKHLGRRGFVAATLFAAGSSLGWLARKMQAPAPAKAPVAPGANPRFTYDVSEFERVDPKLLLYTAAGEFPTRLRRAKRLAQSSEGNLWVLGDRVARLFSAEGEQLKELSFDAPAHALLDAQGQLIVAFPRTFEIYDADGARLMRSPRLGETTFLTSLALRDRTVYLADAGQREVIICDRETGTEIDRFGKRDPARGNPGFEIPSPYFDLALASDGQLRIVNPSRLRIETYTLDGRYVSSWGQPGMQIDRFCGCCNPVYFAIAPNGDFITSEKGLARVKIFAPDGQFKGVVAGPEQLVEDKELAKKACDDCSVGAGFDIALGQQQAILILDPFRKTVRKFAPLQEAPT